MLLLGLKMYFLSSVPALLAPALLSGCRLGRSAVSLLFLFQMDESYLLGPVLVKQPVEFGRRKGNGTSKQFFFQDIDASAAFGKPVLQFPVTFGGVVGGRLGYNVSRSFLIFLSSSRRL